MADGRYPWRLANKDVESAEMLKEINEVCKRQERLERIIMGWRIRVEFDNEALPKFEETMEQFCQQQNVTYSCQISVAKSGENLKQFCQQQNVTDQQAATTVADQTTLGPDDCPPSTLGGHQMEFERVGLSHSQDQRRETDEEGDQCCKSPNQPDFTRTDINPPSTLGGQCSQTQRAGESSFQNQQRQITQEKILWCEFIDESKSGSTDSSPPSTLGGHQCHQQQICHPSYTQNSFNDRLQLGDRFHPCPSSASQIHRNSQCNSDTFKQALVQNSDKVCTQSKSSFFRTNNHPCSAMFRESLRRPCLPSGRSLSKSNSWPRMESACEVVNMGRSAPFTHGGQGTDCWRNGASRFRCFTQKQRENDNEICQTRTTKLGTHPDLPAQNPKTLRRRLQKKRAKERQRQIATKVLASQDQRPSTKQKQVWVEKEKLDIAVQTSLKVPDQCQIKADLTPKRSAKQSKGKKLEKVVAKIQHQIAPLPGRRGLNSGRQSAKCQNSLQTHEVLHGHTFLL